MFFEAGHAVALQTLSDIHFRGGVSSWTRTGPTSYHLPLLLCLRLWLLHSPLPFSSLNMLQGMHHLHDCPDKEWHKIPNENLQKTQIRTSFLLSLANRWPDCTISGATSTAACTNTHGYTKPFRRSYCRGVESWTKALLRTLCNKLQNKHCTWKVQSAKGFSQIAYMFLWTSGLANEDNMHMHQPKHWTSMKTAYLLKTLPTLEEFPAQGTPKKNVGI